MKIFLLFTFTIFIIFCDSKTESEELEEILRSEKYVAVLFTKKCCDCLECVEAEALLSAINFDILDEYQIVTVKLVDQEKLATSYGVKELPAIIFLRDRKPAIYDGKIDKDELLDWFAKSREVALKELNDDSFEHLTQASTGATTGDWLVAFYDDSDNDISITTVLDGVAVRVKNRVNVAKVNVQLSPVLKDRFKIKTSPQVILFRLGKMYHYELPGIKVASLTSFVEGFYRNAKSQTVPKQKTTFDKLVDVGVKLLEANKFAAIAAAVSVILSILLLGWCLREKETVKDKSS